MALLLFVFTTLVYNYYLGENALSFFSTKRSLLQAYRVLVMALVLWGSMQDLSTVFGFADVTMGLLALVNLVAITLLFKVGMRLMRDYDSQVKAGVKEPVFDASKFADLDLDHNAWHGVHAGNGKAADMADGLAQSHR
ncbi:amino acid carrier protein [compost metagenome]